MRIGILALQGDFEAHAEALRRLGCEYRYVRAAADLEGLDGIILPGGESSTMLKFLEAGRFFEQLRDFAARRPAFGTCAGAILLAREVTHPEQPGLGALDAAVVRNAYGRQRESSIRQANVAPEFAAALGAESLEAVLIRAPRFERLGPAVEVVATADEAGGEGKHPVLLRQGHIVAASFHPELGADGRVHRWFLDLAARAAK